MEQKNKTDYGLPPKEALILEEYREQRPIFEKLLRVVKRVLRESIEENKIYINAIEGRVKAEDSLAGKLERKSGKYNSLSDLTDILGVRVITFYSDEVDKVAALVGRLFEIDWENSIDKRKMHEIHSFGYNSLHFICRLPKERYFDPAYPQMNEIRFEVQMRTALQHVWVNKRIASINQAEIHETSLSRFLAVFVSFGFTTLGDIDRMIKRNMEDAYQLAAFQLAGTDLDIINSSLGVISLCAVHVLKQGGGVLELTRFLENLNGVTTSNKHRAEGIFRVAQNLSFMKK